MLLLWIVNVGDIDLTDVLAHHQGKVKNSPLYTLLSARDWDKARRKEGGGKKEEAKEGDGASESFNVTF